MKLAPWLPLLPLLLALVREPQPASASLVVVNRGLAVARGGRALLTSQELRVEEMAAASGDACRLEVVQNEPITQRAGKVAPHVFNCRWAPGEVSYTHHGTPLLDHDLVLLRLYRFSDSDTQLELVHLLVTVSEPAPGTALLLPGPSPLRVASFMGTSGALDRSVLSLAPDAENPARGRSCWIRVPSEETGRPAHGRLVAPHRDEAADADFGPDPEGGRGDTPHSFGGGAGAGGELAPPSPGSGRLSAVGAVLGRVPCERFLSLGLRYEHLSPPGPDVDYVPLVLEIREGSRGQPHKVEHMWLPVHIEGAVPNQPPHAAPMSSFILEVDQFILTPISVASLDAKDGETPRHDLVFNVTEPPAEGFLTHLSDHTRPVTSFTWRDLNEMLVAYQPPNSSHAERRTYEAEFEVHDSYFARSAPLMLHISIRNTETNAPRVSWNMGLDLLEGQSRAITWDRFQVVDNDDLAAVRILAVGGLQHGRLSVRGAKGFSFSVRDLRDGAVRYHHDGSDGARDHVALRLTDGRHSARHSFPVRVAPVDDTPPALVVALALAACAGETVPVSPEALRASDPDEPHADGRVLFTVTAPPAAGRLLRKDEPGGPGQPVERFLQRDLFDGLIFYEHRGGKELHDAFEFVLSDTHEPPNVSDKQTMTVHVTPVDNEVPREVAGGARRALAVRETELAVLTREMLLFSDADTPPQELLFVLVRPCRFVDGAGGSLDAGKLVSMDSMTKATKDASVAEIRSFTQHAVNHLKVAYMPPMADVGPWPRSVEFAFTVTDRHGGVAEGFTFNITVLPVDNQPPQLEVFPVHVDEGAWCALGEEALSVWDADSEAASLALVVSRRPRHGELLLDGVALLQGDRFTAAHTRGLRLTYQHDGSETLEDDVVITATDGTNTAEGVLRIQVSPVNDESPQLLAGLLPELPCPEGGAVPVTVAHLSARDADSVTARLLYLVARAPSHGTLTRAGVPTLRFTQGDVARGLVAYAHTGGEIGLHPVHDTVTLVLSDAEAGSRADGAGDGGGGDDDAEGGEPLPLPAHDSLPIHDLNITVTPVDNEPPSLAVGAVLLVEEAGRVRVSAEHLTALDPDTPAEQLLLVLVAPPRFGFMENTRPSPGHERSNAGISVGSFSLHDLLAGHVNYVQSRHEHVEPTGDQLSLHATDGERRSRDLVLHVLIAPANDEPPALVARNITVLEGHSRELGPSVIDAVDLDVPADALRFSVVTEPRHGVLVCGARGADPSRRRRLTGTQQHADGAESHADGDDAVGVMSSFGMEQLKQGLVLTYVHDGSESADDAFSVRVWDGAHAATATVAVHVQPVNDEPPRLTRNAGAWVDWGESRVISSAELDSEDGDTGRDGVSFVLAGAPRQGSLQHKSDGGEWRELLAGAAFSQEDVDENRLRYRHHAVPAAALHDSFRFTLTDGDNAAPPSSFVISIRDALKGDIAVRTGRVSVAARDSAALSADALLASDASGRPDELLFVVTAPPAHGRLELAASPGVGAGRFTQADVAAGAVRYVHTGPAGASRDSFSFLVSNGLRTRLGSLDIDVESRDVLPPTLERNGGLRLAEGTLAAITSAALRLADPDTAPQDLRYVVTEPPSHGALYLRGQLLAVDESGSPAFTQRDVDQSDVAYRHSGGPAHLDHFSFLVRDPTDRGVLLEGRLTPQPIVFSIQVEPLDRVAPRVTLLSPPRSVESLRGGRYGIRITIRHLRATDNEDAAGNDEDITFSIMRPPLYGYLENTASGDFIRGSFCQRELREKRVMYIVNPSLDVTEDSLEFRVSDRAGNTGETQTLQLEWARVQMAEVSVRVCENVGTLAVRLLRSGCAQDSAFVGIKVRGLSAVVGKDFTHSSASLVQFDPGVTSRTWNVAIKDDGLQEATERLRVYLHAPINAVLGAQDSTLVAIADGTAGRCDASHGGDFDDDDGGGDDGDGDDAAAPLTIRMESLQPGYVSVRGDVPDFHEKLPGRGAGGGGGGGGAGGGSWHVPGQLDVAAGRPVAAAPRQTARLRAIGSGKVVPPSSVIRNKTDVMWTYHGLVPLRLEKEAVGGAALSQASVSVRARQAPESLPFSPAADPGQEPPVQADKPAPAPGPQDSQEQVFPESTFPKQCTPELKDLMHFDPNSNQLFKCDGVTWRAWDPKHTEAVGQRCPSGWTHHGGRCFLLVASVSANWAEAERSCRQTHDGTLVSVRSREEMSWLWDFGSRQPFWIGLSDRQEEGSWQWTNGDPVTFTNWRGGGRSDRDTAPHGGGGGGRRRRPRGGAHGGCVLAQQRGKWARRGCRGGPSLPYVCVRE
uniref:FRAS1-related extracellular matrix protein 1 n=1 Tax=Petromyzon marinus TaxID=7757 RepID=A0AAJ7TQD9_PETMA|nr:FRAS1-related extracellular matrix protein 1 [Petromyzon marinus]XP_032822131.1 FRAS1-related extracellular matrix protein 1 [Petromyzon marinus]